MELYPNQYYHFYNRSNNSEVVFKSRDDYNLFLKKYKSYLEAYLDTIAYCLMPTHFHFLVYIKSLDVHRIKKNIGVLLSSYARTINLLHQRHGSLFQHHTKAKNVDDDEYLVALLTYIHQNPVRAGLVKTIEEWEFSSYRDVIGIDREDGTSDSTRPTIKTEMITNYFSSTKDFEEYSRVTLKSVKKEFWV